MRSKEKKRAARDRRNLRRDLVHGAGCTEPLCLTRLEAFDRSYVREMREIGIRIPRSIARKMVEAAR